MINPKRAGQKKQDVIKQLWLTYYNDTLYAKGIISEEQRNKMRVKINEITASASK